MMLPQISQERKQHYQDQQRESPEAYIRPIPYTPQPTVQLQTGTRSSGLTPGNGILALLGMQVEQDL